jgi:hypothetical protein
MILIFAISNQINYKLNFIVMKKTNTLLSIFLLALFGTISMWAQTVTIPEVGVSYTIKHIASAFFLERSGGETTPVINAASGDTDQAFEFVLVNGTTDTYNIKCQATDEFFARADAGNIWTMIWVEDPNSPDNWPSSTLENKAQNAQWKIVAANDGSYVNIQSAANTGGYIGTDYVVPGSATYADKGQTLANSQWYIKEFTGEVDKAALQNKYDEAKILFDNTTQGTDSDQYPANTRTALATALKYALEVLDDEGALQDDVNAALLDLNTALDNYRKSVYPFLPDPAKTYYIQHSSSYYFTGNSIAAATYVADQQFKFVAVGGQWFNIQLANDATQYLTRSDNGYSLIWAADGTVTTAHFTFKSSGDGYYTIQCAALTGDKIEPYWFIGTDNNTAGSGAYVDKNGTDGKHKWKIFDITTLPVIKDALEEAVANAAEFLQYAVRGEGADQYPATEYDALTAAKTAAEAVIANTNATQLQVSDATLALNSALSACLAAVTPLEPDVTKEYQIVHSGGLFLNALEFTGYEGMETDKPNALTIAEKSGADNQKIKFLASDVASAYNITVASIPGRYLTRCTDPHPNEEGKYDDYKLIWLENAASSYAKFEIKRATVAGYYNYYTIKCITAGPTRTNSYAGTDATTAGSGISIDKNGTSSNHFWKIQEFGTTNALKQINANDVFVYAGNGSLKISRLKGNNRISVYNAVGQLMTTAPNSRSEFETQLPKGIYVVVVNGDSPYRGKAIVK